MTESEKRLREHMQSTARHAYDLEGRALLDALLTEHRAEVSAARDAALEEVRVVLELDRRDCESLISSATDGEWMSRAAVRDYITDVTSRVDAMKSKPGRRTCVKCGTASISEQDAERGHTECVRCYNTLDSSEEPARRLLDAEKVREVLDAVYTRAFNSATDAIDEVASMLGVDLGPDPDATPASTTQKEG